MSAADCRLTWWGASAVELRTDDTTLAVDPYLQPDRADFVCLTREDWDHTHEPTLRRITDRGGLRHVLAPPSCLAMSKLDAPVGDAPQDLAFIDQDRITTVEPTVGRKLEVKEAEHVLGPFSVTVTQSSEREQPTLLDGSLMHRWRPDDGTPWPAQTGRFLGGGRFRPVGYLVRMERAAVTVLHPGDLQEAFDGQRALRGRVDVMLFPSILLEGVELTVLDNIRPRYILPIHHRTDDPDFPIPLDVRPEDVEAVDFARGLPRDGATPDAVRRDRARLQRGHWYASADPGLTRLRSLAPSLAELGCELLVARPGEPVELSRLARAAHTGA